MTDLLNLRLSTDHLHDRSPPKSFRKSFGPAAGDPGASSTIGREVSPVFHASKPLPPVFIVQGDAGTPVPLEQSTQFRDAAAKLGREMLLTVHPGKKNGCSTMIWDAHLFANWLAERVR